MSQQQCVMMLPNGQRCAAMGEPEPDFSFFACSDCLDRMGDALDDVAVRSVEEDLP